MNEVIHFPKYATRYEVRGPSFDELLDALKPGAQPVTFTFIGREEGALLTQDVRSKIDQLKRVNEGGTIFSIEGTLVEEGEPDTRLRVERYDTLAKSGQDAGLFL